MIIERLNLGDEQIRSARQGLDLLRDRSRDAGTGAARCRSAPETAGARRDADEAFEVVQLLVEPLSLGVQAIRLGDQGRHLLLYPRGKAAGATGAGELALKEVNLSIEGLPLRHDGVGLHHHARHLLRDDGGAAAAGTAAAEAGELPFEEISAVIDRPRLSEDTVCLRGEVGYGPGDGGRDGAVFQTVEHGTPARPGRFVAPRGRFRFLGEAAEGPPQDHRAEVIHHESALLLPGASAAPEQRPPSGNHETSHECIDQPMLPRGTHEPNPAVSPPGRRM